MKMLFAIVVAGLLFSCKTSAPTHELATKNETECNYALVVQFQDTGIRSEIMNAIVKITKPVEVVITNQSIGFMPSVMEIRISYVALSDKAIQNIRRELYKCQGIVGISINRN